MNSVESNLASKKILFFDGVCALCHFSVHFFINRKALHDLMFASLQGETSRQLLQFNSLELKSLIYWNQGTKLESSDAVLALFAEWSPWGAVLAALARVFPYHLRESVYFFVSSQRYKWFGKFATCPLPEAKDRHRFLP